MKKLWSLILVFALVATLFIGIPVQAASVVAYGIDVSKWQGTINWNSVASHNHGDFAILRAYCYGKDTTFETNYAGAKAAGVPVGAYCFIYGTTTSAVQAEVNGLIAAISGKQFEYPIYIDVEDADTYASVGRQTTTNLVAMACKMLEDAGYYAGVYTYTSFSNSYIYMSQLSAYTTWIADYRSSLGYTGAHDMWQYSCTGSVSGISGDVDLNYSYLDFPTIIKSIGINGYEPSVTYPYDVDSNTRMLYDGESKSYVTTAFSTTATVYSGNKTQGDNSLKLTFSNPAATASTNKVGGMAVLKLTSATDLTGYDYIQFDVYLSRTMTGSHGFQLNFITDTTEDGYNYLKGINDWAAGWHTITVERSAIGKAVSSADWSSIQKMRIAWWNYAGVSEETYFLVDNIRALKSIATDIIYPYQSDSKTMMLMDGESIGGMKEAFSTNVSLDTSNKTQGSSSMKMTFNKPAGYAANGNIGGMILQSFKEATDLSAYDYFEVDVYFSRAMTGSHALQINFGAGSQDGYNASTTIRDYAQGWHTIRITMSEIPAAKPANADWTKIDTMRYTWFNHDLQEESTYFLIDNARVVKEEQVIPSEPEPSSEPSSEPSDVPVEILPYGDINENDMVNAADALSVLKFAVGKQLFTDRQLILGDVDGDGAIDAKDALLILRYAVSLIDSFPVETM